MEAPATPPPDKRIRKTLSRSRGILAAAATLILPGLGHWWAGDKKRALWAFYLMQAVLGACLSALVCPPIFPALLFLLPVGGLLTIVVLVDAYRTACRSSLRMLGVPWRRQMAGLALLLISPVINEGMAAGVLAHFTMVRSFSLDGHSMEPTLGAGDHILVLRHGTPRRWSIVTFGVPGSKSPVADAVDRVVGLPGETVAIAEGHVVINGQPVPFPAGVGPYHSPEHFAFAWIGSPGNPVHLAADEYFVIGDNSSKSFDSRYFQQAAAGHQVGAVPAGEIHGVATWIYWPPSRWRRLDNP